MFFELAFTGLILYLGAVGVSFWVTGGDLKKCWKLRVK